MEMAFTILWYLWAPLAAWLVRAVVVRSLHAHWGDASYIIAYLVWLVGFFFSIWFVAWSGMQMYGFNRSDPWQVAGAIALWFSPFGLPLIFGAPIVFVADLVRFAVIARRDIRARSAT
jgi:hypothetical protein